MATQPQFDTSAFGPFGAFFESYLSAVDALGQGKLPAAPGFTPPYAIAVVELDEGPRMMSNIVDCPQTPEALVLDMKLEVAFEKLDDKITLPLFRPAKG